MIKKGFTLAEVLIAMAIVGVVASLTAPWLMMNKKNAANATKLATIVSDLDNAFSSMVVDEQVDSLRETAWMQANVNDRRQELAKHIAITNPVVQGNENYSYNTLGNGYKKSSNKTSFSSSNAYNLKNGAIVYIRYAADDGRNVDSNLQQGGNLGSVVANVFIDVNGLNEPNTVGRDLFYFALGADGMLYPYGGKDYSIYNSGNETSIWSNQDAFACNDTNVHTFGQGCTGRVVEEGYKITY